MTLNSEGLEKAADALAKIYHGEGDEPFHLMATTAISAYLSSLPPVDGLEVVAWDVASKGLPAEPTKSHSFVAEIERQGGWITPLVTLSQASSVIAGLTKERDEALRRESSSIMGEIEATQRISSLEEEKQYWWEKAHEENGLRVHLEEEIKRLREALKQQIPGHRDPEGDCWCRYGHNPDYGHTLSCVAARKALEDHNG